MDEVRVYRISDGEQFAKWTTPDFTSWGIIKSHCYVGGIFSMQFTPDGKLLTIVGSQGQPEKKENGNFPDFGRVEVFAID